MNFMIRNNYLQQQNLELPFAVKYAPKIPSTRYQGSKAKLVNWIWDAIKDLDFNCILDVFGGTGVVGYYMKQKNKEVHYNDYLKSNYYIGLSLIENNNVTLKKQEIESVLREKEDYKYGSLISGEFKDIYYTEEENLWLDIVVQNIEHIKNIYKKSLLYNALFQACLVKRPFNLFHRKNLYIRFADVKRTFGNKATWDKPFKDHFLEFASEINSLVYDNNKNNRAHNKDVFDIEGEFDLIYIDPPYTSSKGVSVDYLSFYHFLEGLVNYNSWEKLIDYRTKNKSFRKKYNIWNDKFKVRSAFKKLFEKFKRSIIVVSYRSDGIPAIEEIKNDLGKFKKNVRMHFLQNYKYVLSSDKTSEVLLIGY